MALSLSGFYGKKKQKESLLISTRLARQERDVRQTVGPAPYRSRLSGPSQVWKVFYRQQEALDFLSKVVDDVHVFSFESSSLGVSHGQRLFLVASYPAFWHYYRQLKSEQRHHYELIRQDVPCYLYFDLEFSRDLNPQADGPAMTHIFIKYVLWSVLGEFGVSCVCEDVLQLDASTPHKYSCHLIINNNSLVFKDNIQAGHFVKFVIGRLYALIDTQENCNNIEASTSTGHQNTTLTDDKANKNQDNNLSRLGSNINNTRDGSLEKAGLTVADVRRLVVRDKSDSKLIFCDTGVYTKNRNFRLYLSSKLGKNNPLVLGEDNLYKPPADTAKQSDEQMFLASLVTNVGPTTDQSKLLCFDEVTGATRAPPLTSVPRSVNTPARSGYQASPHPAVDGFVEMLIRQGGVSGTIRRWAYFPADKILTYDILHNRWCERIQRHHRSNNIIIVVNLRQGVYYQKCQDPDCRAANFKSKEYLLPQSLLPWSVLCGGSGDELSDAELAGLLDDNTNTPEQQDEAGSDELTDTQIVSAECHSEHTQSISTSHRDLSDTQLVSAVPGIDMGGSDSGLDSLQLDKAVMNVEQDSIVEESDITDTELVSLVTKSDITDTMPVSLASSNAINTDHVPLLYDNDSELVSRIEDSFMSEDELTDSELLTLTSSINNAS